MKNINLRGLLSAICLASILGAFTGASAGPVRFNNVTQVVNPRPGNAGTSNFSRLRLTDDIPGVASDDSEDKKKEGSVPQDGRVITETKTEIVTDDVCETDVPLVTKGRGFPYWILLGLAAIPIGLITFNNDDDPNPTPTPTPNGTPTPTPPGGISAFSVPCTPGLSGNVNNLQFIGQTLGLQFLVDGVPVVPDASGYVTIPPGLHNYAVIRISDGVAIAQGSVTLPDCAGGGSTPTPTPVTTPTPATPTPTPVTTPTPTPVTTPTPEPSPSPTGTPTENKTPTPTPNTTPTPEPTVEVFPTPTPTPPGGISAFAAPCTPATGNISQLQFIGQQQGLRFLLDGAQVVPDAAGYVTVPPGPHTYAVIRISDGFTIAQGSVTVPDCNGSGTPTPTPDKTPDETPTPDKTPTPEGTPTPRTTTPTPPPPEPVPEPMTILLFGTGLASIGVAARRRFGKKSDAGDEKEEE